MARKNNFLGEDLNKLLQNNGKLLTGFAALLIIVVGITIVENRSNWWVSLLAVGMFFIIAFLFLNARAFIKGLVSLILVLVLGSYGFQFGAMIDPIGVNGSLWMTSIYATYFLMLCVSFAKPSTKSRWGVATLVTVLQFLITITLITVGVNPAFSILSSAFISLILFTLLYYYGIGARVKTSKMPLIGMSSEEQQTLHERIIDSGWGAWKREKKNVKSVVTWNNKTAFNLTVLNLEQKFGVKASRFKTELSYNGESISPWLLDLVYTLTPNRGTANSDIMLVLLDEQNVNGNEAKVIGVSVPDSKKQIPVGVFPYKNFNNKFKTQALLKKISEEFDDFVIELSKKQVEYLDSHLPDEGDEDKTVEGLVKS